MGDEQIVLNTGAGTVSGTRFYSIGGTTIAARTSAITVDYLIPDRQGTDLLAVNASTQAVTRRQYLPFGAARGTVPAGWPGDRGYVGGSADTATSMETLGARQYDPATGRFLSADPVFEAGDPQQVGGYDYAGNNPVTGSDPSGLMLMAPSDGGGCPSSGCPGSRRSSSGNSNDTIQNVESGGVASGVLHFFDSILNAPATIVHLERPSIPIIYNVNFGGEFDTWWRHRLGISGASPDGQIMRYTSDATGIASLFIPVGGIVRGASGASDILRGLSAAKDLRTATAPEAAIDPVANITAKLQAHVDRAAAAFHAGSLPMSARQAALAAADPTGRALAAARGQVIDAVVKRAVAADTDPALAMIYVTRSGEVGPDFLDLNSLPGTPQWWDITTPEKWAQHLRDYGGFGNGTPLFTR
jgi:RHS repeat-associated protein